jgi:RNA recognition motif-containing protein
MNLFVANINRDVTEDAIRTLFTGCGEVASVKIIKDRATGIPKGFGFVEMPDDSEAQEAINKLTNTNLLGKNLVVSQAKPKSSFH